MMMMMMMMITALNIFGITECFQIKSKDGVIQLLQQSLRELPEQLKLKKKREKSGKCKGLRGKVARLRNVNDSESRKSWSFGYGEECNFFRPG